MDVNFLEEIGFTKAEIKVYLSLLKLGSVNAGKIIENSGLQNSVVHLTLPKLISKGLVSYIKKGNVRYFSATNPKVLLEYVDRKRDEVEKSLPELIAISKKENKQEAELYEGFKGFRSANEKLTSQLDKGEDYYFFAFNPKNPDLFEQVFNFYNHFDKELEEKGINVKGIVPRELKNKLKKRNPKSIIYVDFPIPNNITFSENHVLLNSYTDDGKINSFLISSPSLAESFKSYFISIWKSKYE